MLEPLLDLIAWCGVEHRFLQRAFLAVLLLAPACAVLGVPVINLRLAFMSDAIGHAALAGVAVGLLVGIDPRLSTALLALGMAAAILLVLAKGRLSPDTAIGVLAAGVVSAGLALISRQRELGREATRFLYGDVLTVSDGDLVLLLILAVVVWVVVAWRWNRWLALALHADLATVHGRAGVFDRLVFAVLVALVSVVAARVVGVLLVTAMLIVPAAAARCASRRASSQPWIAAGLGLVAGTGGLLLSALPVVATAAGPTMVLLEVALFVVVALVSAWRR